MAGTSDYSLTPALKVNAVYLRNIDGSGVQYLLEHKSKYDLLNMPYTTTGMPVTWSFRPNLAEGGTLTIWPIPTATDATTYELLVVSQDGFDTFTASGETPDFPAYWSDAIIYALAVALAPEKGIPLNDRKQLQQEAAAYLAQTQGYSDEDGSIFDYSGLHPLGLIISYEYPLPY